jgi:sugar lactone lactonase YvrE
VGTAAQLNLPGGVAVDGAGNIYFSDTGNHCIRKIPAGGGATSRVAGACTVSGAADGAGTAARFSRPLALAFDPGGYLYVAEQLNQRIRKVHLPDGYTTTVFQNSSAVFNGVALDGAGTLYFVDGSGGGSTVDRLDPGGGSTLIAGTGLQYADGPGCSARFRYPTGLAVMGSTLFVGDLNYRVRRVELP